MNWYEFVFSTKRRHRLIRHVVFWLMWAIYFSASYFHYHQVGLQKIQFEDVNIPYFLKASIQLFIHITTCYFFIDYLLPNYMRKGKYSRLAWNILGVSILIFLTGYFIHKTIFPLINNAFDYHPVIAPQNIWWTSATSYLLSAPKVICLAAAIRLFKHWWLKEKEKEILEKEKLLADLQLLKAQMHPEFLFSSLDNIGLLLKKKNIHNAALSLLKLADILSYMLYECDNKMVPLEKEIRSIRDYILLFKNKMSNRLEVDIAVKGDVSNYEIVPLLLFPFIENSFSSMFNKGRGSSWITLEFQVDKNILVMKLIHGKNEDHVNDPANKSNLDKVIKRLNFFYPDRYEIKSTVEPEMMMTSLRIFLREHKVETENYEPLINQLTYASI